MDQKDVVVHLFMLMIVDPAHEGRSLKSRPQYLYLIPRCYGLDQDLIGTVEIEFFGEPSITLSLYTR
jgi:hypothetical protein